MNADTFSILWVQGIMSGDTKSRPSAPRAKTIIIILTAVMTFRVVAIMFLPEAARSESPLVPFFIPLLGDTLIGLTAPIIARAWMS